MKKEVKIGLFVMAILAIFVYFLIKTESLVDLLAQKKRYPVFARFTSIAGMYRGAAVRMAGVKIGSVDNIRLDRRKAAVRMMIDKTIVLTEDARAIISTIGFVGEQFVEIVYKDEFKIENPKTILPDGVIMTIDPFNLDEVKTKFDTIYEKIVRITDSINGVISDKESQDSLRSTFVNLKSITDNLKEIVSEKGELQQTFASVDQITARLQRTIASIDDFVKEVNRSVTDRDTGVIRHIQESSSRLLKITDDLRAIGDDLRKGKGTAGKLLQQDELYRDIDETVQSAHSLLKELETKKNNLSRIRLSYGINFDYFARIKMVKTSLHARITTPGFTILSGVNDDPESGDTRFTLMGGKRIAAISIAAGLFESQLGANLGLSLLKDRLNLNLFAAKFYGGHSPLIRTTVAFSLSKNVQLLAGYDDFFYGKKRQFTFGIGLGN
jgi:phospholipid/cholesterol/gamma-HCH transport system substrate-binding protein